MDKDAALLFKNNLVGLTNGHMACIPNNPTAYSAFQTLIEAKKGYCEQFISTDDFVQVLSDIVDALKNKGA